MTDKKLYEPLVVATALALYRFNVAPLVRAEKLYDHFKGDCMELAEITDCLRDRRGYEVTELPYPTAQLYIDHAMERYGKEAESRVKVEREGIKPHYHQGFYQES